MPGRCAARWRGFHPDSNARRWACCGPWAWPPPRPVEQRRRIFRKPYIAGMDLRLGRFIAIAVVVVALGMLTLRHRAKQLHQRLPAPATAAGGAHALPPPPPPLTPPD